MAIGHVAGIAFAAWHYIQTQPEHHRRKTYQEEFLELLKAHEIEYDERYVFD